jgi:hypothetical protein
MVEASSINELSNLAKQLNSQSDSLNKSIATLNDHLASLNLGLEVWLDAGPFPLEDSGYYIIQDRAHPHVGKKGRDTITLGYSKVEDKWQLAIKDESFIYEGKGDDQDEISDGCMTAPLLKATREVRTEAVRHFDRLIDHMKTQARSMLENIASAEKLAKVS